MTGVYLWFAKMLLKIVATLSKLGFVDLADIIQSILDGLENVESGDNI